MSETIGTLNLKIARLEHQVRVLNQQQLLSSIYPEHQAGLVQQILQVQIELSELMQYRDRLRQQTAGWIRGGNLYGNRPGQKPFYAIN